jgi:pyridoxamine 5'-phosphate oxidase
MRDDPIAWCAEWFAEATTAEPINPTAMSVATVDVRGNPAVRMVLMRGFDKNGVVFYTNTESAKGDDFARHPYAALCFYWKSLGRQLRITGNVEFVTEQEADEYFASRPDDSQIGAWASQQSRVLHSREHLIAEVERFTRQYATTPVPRPPYWSGYRVKPDRIEFWEERPHRLHQRTVFAREENKWAISELFP